MNRLGLIFTTFAGLVAASAAKACKIALLLMIDVSSSIDPGEYRFQIDGMADALRDPVIAEILVRDQVALSVVQWSGIGEAEVSLEWQRMLTPAAVVSFANRARAIPRRWQRSRTAVGDAIAFGAEQFGPVSDCTRRVMDVSGDGASNVGFDTATMRREIQAMGIEINGLAIDRIGRSVTEFYRRFMITQGGFVMTATGYSDYPRAISAKLFRELVKPAS
ncbi:DUF1194 domain-containing protein [Abyssibius alkaniclasticus]|uniref:DUF1194 domain-containing protein n=1 Tax=Abyssibius alkaniclasticus TaxID=2881234 RepID=UPI0023634812|nr:DUF1194 domain-containing protein [Abyssibius alkaniclasticus]UPH72169.1 DUF1194 domain-containing protein [Abyssibius alkaniclasticus]